MRTTRGASGSRERRIESSTAVPDRSTEHAGQGATTSTTSARVAAGVFGASALLAIPLLAFVLGDFHWFLADDWYFIADRRLGSVSDLFAPHNGHWSTVPVVFFRVVWSVFGARTYLPYQLGAIVAHVGVTVLLRMVMRRAGVGPWLASAAAGALLLFGPGGANIIWGFQVGFNGAVLFGLAQLLLADHDGRVDRRDAGGLLAGTLAVASAGTGLPVVVATGIALLVRRGWRRALLHTAPLAVLYGIWSLFGPDDAIDTPEARPGDLSTTSGGLPSIGTVARWVRTVYVATFEALGHHTVVAVALATLLVVGLGLVVVSPPATRSERLRQVAAPAALAAGGVLFALLTAVTRWQFGDEFARSGRYVYLSAALTLPLLAVAADAVARRWRQLTPVLAVLFLVTVPVNLGMFDDGFFGPAYHETQRALVTSAVRVPYADEVSPDARPLTGPFLPDDLDLGFLLEAARDGKIERSTGAVPTAVADELEVRLNLVHEERPLPPGECRMVAPGDALHPVKGSVYSWDDAHGAIRVRRVTDGQRRAQSVDIHPVAGAVLVAQRDGTAFDWEPADPTEHFELCERR